jgi:hypothetical protein
MFANQVQGLVEPKHFSRGRKDRKGHPNLTKSKTDDCPESSGTDRQFLVLGRFDPRSLSSAEAPPGAPSARPLR